jgi:hypothetical protein
MAGSSKYSFTPLREPYKHSPKWRFVALSGAFTRGFVVDLESSEEFRAIHASKRATA